MGKRTKRKQKFILSVEFHELTNNYRDGSWRIQTNAKQKFLFEWESRNESTIMARRGEKSGINHEIDRDRQDDAMTRYARENKRERERERESFVNPGRAWKKLTLLGFKSSDQILLPPFSSKYSVEYSVYRARTAADIRARNTSYSKVKERRGE